MTAEAGKSGPAAAGSDLRRIARYGQEAERCALAASAATPPELLFFLGADRSPAVRRQVAANRATPPQADRILARDEDPQVRAVLARRLAALAPGLGPQVADRLRRIAWETLCLLAEDAIESVRAAVAETLAEMPDAPRDLILRLARDLAVPVAGPVIRLSPVLTDQDLLALIASPPAPFTRCIVASRPHLAPELCDAIARCPDGSAILALLANASARLRVDTLEHLAQRAVLSPQARSSLAGLVAEEWARELARRADLPAETARRLREALASRAAARHAARAADSPLPEEAFLAAAARQDAECCIATLAARSGVPSDLIRRAGRLRSARALLAIAWKAGFSPAVALPVQTVVGGLPPEAALAATPGTWPLSPAEMQAHLDRLLGG